MKVSCLQENFNRGLGTVGRAVATRTTLPITSHVLLATDGGRLKLAATNLEIALSCWIGAQVEEEGSITIPARLLLDFVSSLPAEKIEMTLAQRSRQLRLVCARNQLTLAAADGFRLSVHKLTLQEKAAERTEVIVPARALGELNRLLADEQEAVEMTLNAARTQVLFKLTNVELVAQLIQGTFPDYSRLIPQSFASRAVVDASEFLRETRIASIFARDGSGIVRLQFAPGEGKAPGHMAISARAEEVGDNRGEIDAQVEGDEAKIAFNGRYLQDVLSVMDGGRVVLEVTTPSQQGVIRPLDDHNFVHVIMPMFVQ